MPQHSVVMRDNNIVLGEQMSMEELLRQTRARAQSASAIATPHGTRHLETAKAHWEAEKRALPRTFCDVFGAVADADMENTASQRDVVENKAKVWRNIDSALAKEIEADQAEMTKVDLAQRTVNGDISAVVTTNAPEAAAFRVLINAHKTLNTLWTRYLRELEEAHRSNHVKVVSQLAGVHAAHRAVLKTLEEDRAYTTAQFDKIKDMAPQWSSPALAQCADARAMFFDKVWEPLASEMRERGINTTALDAAVHTTSNADDPFCVRRCIAVEELLSLLPEALPSTGRAQSVAMTKCHGKIRDLRHIEQKLQASMKEALARSDMRSIGAIKVINTRQEMVKTQLAETAEEIKRLASEESKSTDQPLSFATTATVPRVLKACRELRSTLDAMREASEAMSYVARDQCRTSHGILSRAAKDERHGILVRALNDLSQLKRQFDTALAIARQTLSEAAIVDEARSSQRFESNTSGEMRLHGLVERSVQLQREGVQLMAKRIEMQAMQRAARFVSNVCTHLLKDLTITFPSS